MNCQKVSREKCSGLPDLLITDGARISAQYPLDDVNAGGITKFVPVRDGVSKALLHALACG